MEKKVENNLKTSGNELQKIIEEIFFKTTETKKGKKIELTKEAKKFMYTFFAYMIGIKKIRKGLK